MGRNQVTAGRETFVDVDVDVDVDAQARRAVGDRAARRAFGLRACGVGLMLLLAVAGHAQVPGAPHAPNAANVPSIPRAGQTMRDLETVRPELPAPSVWSWTCPRRTIAACPPRPPTRGYA